MTRLEVALLIAARAPASNAHASNAVVLEQSLQAFSAIRLSLAGCFIAAFDLGTSFRMGAPAVASRTVALNNLVITENGALGNVLTRARIGLRSTAWSIENRSSIAGTAAGLLSWCFFAAFDLVAADRIDAPSVAGGWVGLDQLEVTLLIAARVPASNAHVSNAVELEQSVQALSAFWFSLAGRFLSAFDLGTGLGMGAPAESGAGVALNDLVITEGAALGSVLTNGTQAESWMGSAAWSSRAALFARGAVGFLTWSCLTTFDLVASFRVDAPRMTGAAATLPWSEEAIIIALGFRASNAD